MSLFDALAIFIVESLVSGLLIIWRESTWVARVDRMREEWRSTLAAQSEECRREIENQAENFQREITARDSRITGIEREAHTVRDTLDRAWEFLVTEKSRAEQEAREARAALQAGQSGGITINTEGDANIGGGVVGRDEAT